ncbi:MAG: DUF4432 family protein, partial [Planctomycetota bacterium]
IETHQGDVSVRLGRFSQGISDGVAVVRIDTGEIIVWVLPTRGMAIWKIESAGLTYGWESPVGEAPVHPMHVPLQQADGIGWLCGFNELLTRCGMQSNGAVEFDENDRLRYPLHGRVGNLPAGSISIDYDSASGRVDLIGHVVESQMFVKRLHLRSRVRVYAGGRDVEILDDVSGELSTPQTMQMLYHINIGSPILEENARIVAPIARLTPKDDHAAQDMTSDTATASGNADDWSRIPAPTTGYSERVFFVEPQADDGDRTRIMLKNADGDAGMGISYGTKQLPHFVVWKNPGAIADGYVVGLEPATNLPNRHSFEKQHGRVVMLEDDTPYAIRLTLHVLNNAESVSAFEDQIKLLGDGVESQIDLQPDPELTELSS